MTAYQNITQDVYDSKKKNIRSITTYVVVRTLDTSPTYMFVSVVNENVYRGTKNVERSTMVYVSIQITVCRTYQTHSVKVLFVERFVRTIPRVY